MHKLHCHLQDLPGALERYLRVIRIRGYDLLHIQAENAGNQLRLSLTVSEGRGLQQLVAQLQKLEETISILSIATGEYAGTDSGRETMQL